MCNNPQNVEPGIKTIQDGMFWLSKNFSKNYRLVLISGAILVFALGLVGFHLGDASSQIGGLDWLRATINTLQLFVLNVSGSDLPNAWTLTAGILALPVSFGVVIAAFGGRVRHWLNWLDLQRQGAEDVFLGGGEVATGITMRRSDGRKIVGFDITQDSPLQRFMETRDGKGFFLTANALSNEDLQRMHLHKVRNVWVVMGDDMRNLEAARQVCQMLTPPSDGSTSGNTAVQYTTRILVNVHDRHLARAAISNMFPVQATLGALSLEIFSIPRLAARALLHKHPPIPLHSNKLEPPKFGIQAPHILIVGISDLTEALIVLLAQHCVFNDDPNHSVRITVLSRIAEESVRQAREAFPVLAEQNSPRLVGLLPVARITAHKGYELSVDPQAWMDLQNDQPFDAVYVACENDLKTREAALRIAALRDMEPVAGAPQPFIVACLHQPPGTLGALQQSHNGDEIKGLFDFSVYQDSLRPDENYPGQKQDERAKQFSSIYVEGQHHDSTIVEEAWNKRPDAMRWSDRLTSDHMDVKFDILHGLGLIQDSNWRKWTAQVRHERFADLRDDNYVIELLSRIEHRRFIAERLLEGWLPRAPLIPHEVEPQVFASTLNYRQQKTKLHLNATLVPFEMLATADPNTDQAKKDRDIIEQIDKILEQEAQSVP